MNYVLVLDVAKGKSMFMLSSDYGEVLIEPIEYTHNKSNFELIDSTITKLKEPNINGDLEICETKNKTDKAFIDFLYNVHINF